MKIKNILLSAVIFVALALGLYFLWPMASAGDIKATVRNHDDLTQDEHTGDKINSMHDGHANESQKGEDNDHGDEVVRLSDNELYEFGIKLATAAAGSLKRYVELSGEIVLNGDRMVHVVPRISGIVREVRKTVGDRVESGELMAVLESRDLANSKASYLAAVPREKLAQAIFSREERLWRKKITSEQEYLSAQQALIEARIAKNSAEQQLHALGFSDTELKELPDHPDATYTRFEIRAPFAGTIIEKHLSLGENVGTDAEVFTITNLSSVWVNINVHQKDLASIFKGQSVVIEIGHDLQAVSGKIAWVSPLVRETTRTAKARVVLPNPDGNLRPGLFVTARVAVGSDLAAIIVPKNALQTFEGGTVLFVRTDKGFEPQPVDIGRQDGTQVEILSGIKTGQTYVSQGAFTLKAQLAKGAFGGGHNH